MTKNQEGRDTAPPARKLKRPTGNFVMSVFTMVNSTLGAGMLGVPLAYAKAGLVLAISMNVLVELIAFCTMYFLLVIADACGIYSLGGLAAKLFGFGGLFLVELCTFMNCFGCLWAYIILISDFVPALLKVAGVPEDSIFVERFIIILIVGIAILQLLGWFRSLDALKFTSFLGTISMGLCIVVIIIRCFIPAEGSPKADPPVLLQTNIKAIQTFSTLIFSTCCHQNVPLVLSEYKGRSKPAMTKVLILQVLIVGTFYIAAGSFGYMCFTSQYFTHPTPGNILTMFQERDILPILARCGSLITVTFCYPVQMLPARMALINITSMIKKMIVERNQPKDSKGRVRTFIKVKTATTRQIVTNIEPPQLMEMRQNKKQKEGEGKGPGEAGGGSGESVKAQEGLGEAKGTPPRHVMTGMTSEPYIPFRKLRTQSESFGRHTPIGRGREVTGRLFELEKEIEEEDERMKKDKEWNVLSKETKDADDPDAPEEEEGKDDNDGEKDELMLDEKEQEKMMEKEGNGNGSEEGGKAGEGNNNDGSADVGSNVHEFVMKSPVEMTYLNPNELEEEEEGRGKGNRGSMEDPVQESFSASASASSPSDSLEQPLLSSSRGSSTPDFRSSSATPSERSISPFVDENGNPIETPPLEESNIENLEEEFYIYPPPTGRTATVERSHYLPIPSFALIFGGHSASNEEFDYEYRFVGGEAPPGTEDVQVEEGKADGGGAEKGKGAYEPAQMEGGSTSTVHTSAGSSASSNMIEVTRGEKKKPWGQRTCCGPCSNGLFLSCAIGSCLTAIAMILANFIPTVNLVFDIMGSTAGVSIMFLFPSALYLRFANNAKRFTSTKRYYDPAIPSCYRKNKQMIAYYRSYKPGCTAAKVIAVVLLVSGSLMGLLSLAMALLFDTSLGSNLKI
ncbi:putative AminoAcid/AuxinPermease(AAAP) Family Protein [Monocercomonoides exilis]|uniref:putative AminoAcid/AuxinPermease(AAAP) Family Protein n=1 Tax=Monocercomonoides exilis TaxID=2049356 RepID=UPI00355AAD6E|nr:putative AminoAcid/AuxinPermease(AAAP) Family Protein [Monocercomonoides exilis]|eukprot:MONOS_8037.1-p1 / transcript=MONOS_8037.1 / gene=MONOS_8037 / organism=Monocercomonoides_exilis_PA203 / gene_product=AminoAcid/AuxinPermease(AAAP) Family Protein / transcript_product=AminoAcid/AuxinPermease(AAAP) Family Protein / location=Mono_scaffold00292:13451-16221(+) / protein_length=907 / sequence_SO=supercontig / SO=protein_coding / is_pseudo=false